ncbi:MAG TPA: DUF58 domain-containing protein [Rubrobacteraceae bacterium]|nr:DUF58 domain-containing protein [Rubrobacteraceae bacterium]
MIPTVRGWQATFFGALTLVAARLTGTTQLYQLAYALAGLFVVALVLGFFFSRGLGYARRIPAGERFVAGYPSHVELTFSNASGTRSPGLEVVEHLPERRRFEVLPVEGIKKQTLRERVVFAERGLYRFGPAEIRTTDPFGLLRFARRFEACTEVAVYPKVFELAGFPLRGGGAETAAQGALVRRGDEFSDLREYRRGDDWRHIHWKSVARTGELIVKEFAQNAPQRHAVVLDLHHPGGISTSGAEVEDAVSVAGSVLSHLAQEDLPFRLLCTDKERKATAFGVDDAAYWQTMGLLATVRADGYAEVGTFLDEILCEGRAGLGEGVILVCRSLGKGMVRSVEKLRAAGLFVVVIALAVHTYQTGNASSSGRKTAFDEEVRRLKLARAVVRVVRRPGGVAALAEGRGAAGAVGGAM